VLLLLGVPREGAVVPWAALGFTLVLVVAALKTRASGASAVTVPWLAAAAGLCGVAVLLAARAGRARVAATAAVLAAAVTALRVLTPNPHERIVTAPPPAQPASGPSVFLVVLDTFRADALDLSRGPESRTPNLARLAQRSDVYVDAVANASWTLPGHASLLTGRYVAHHGVDLTVLPSFAPVLTPAVPSAPRLFAVAGWSTACVVANGIVNLPSGLAVGCQRFANPGRIWLESTLPLRLVSLAADSTAALSQLLVEATGLNVNASADEIVERALAEVAAGPEPLFLLLNFLDVHGPLPRPPRADEPPAAVRRAHSLDQLRRSFGRIDEETLWQRHADVQRSYYDAQVRVLDAALGRFFDALAAQGRLDSALVVVTADHGEAFHENAALPGYFGHHSAYEPAVRIPLIVKRPGQREGSVHRELAQQADVLPTLLAVAGLPPAAGADGGVLGAPREEPTVTEWNTPIESTTFPSLKQRREAIYDGPYKYLRDGSGREFLFDLSQSRYEERDVLQDAPDTAARMRAALDAALDPARRPGSGEQLRDEAELREQLRALGYVK
jgi:arylsulfatase A-like enzyme